MTTYRVGGPAAIFVEAAGEDDLVAVAEAVAVSGLPVLVIGRGSNLLVADGGFAGLALALGEPFATIDIRGTEVTAGAAATLPVLARRTAAAGLRGLEWAVGVPGSVGGGVRMNAGGHGSDIAATLAGAQVFDLASASWGDRSAADLSLGYRRSALGPREVVLSGRFALARGDREAAEREVTEVVRWRRQHQPGGANAGSVFTNPPGDSAGRLVEAAGLKGHREGSAYVSPKHANFIQVDDGGSAADVVRLMEVVARRVLESSGVELQPEVHMVGFGPISLSTGGLG